MTKAEAPARLRAQIEAALARVPLASLPAPEAVLPALRAVQAHLHHVPPEAQALVAERLGIPPARVRALVAFYAFLSEHAPGEFDLRVGTCHADDMGGRAAVIDRLAQRLQVAPGSTRADGRVTVGEASCLGLCDQPVSALVNGMPLASLDVERVDLVADCIERRLPLVDWPPELSPRPATVYRRGPLLDDAAAPGAAIAVAHAGGDAVLDRLEEAGLRGRGGAGYPTALKWRLCRAAITRPGGAAVVCNADEGEPGTFKDRMLLETDADRLFEGMSVCAMVLGGARGVLYLRAEYAMLLPLLEGTLARRRAAGLLGPTAWPQLGVAFDIDVVTGAGAYICGEESALIESIEGARGIPRIRPPWPVTHGLGGRPTVVNNVETFVAAASIVAHGAKRYTGLGSEKSRGSKLLSVSGDCERRGIYEYPFGVTLAEVLADCGAQAPCAVQVGGPSGTLVGADQFDRPLAYEALATGGAIMVLGRGRNVLDLVRNHTRFFAEESCGFCTPCRVGTALLRDLAHKVHAGHGTGGDLEELKRLATLINHSSHCGLGQTAGNTVLQSLQSFEHSYRERLTSQDFHPGFDLDAALAPARALSGRDDPLAHLDPT